MERLSYYEHVPKKADMVESPYKSGFESYTHIFEDELEVFSFSPTTEKFKVPKAKASRGGEVLWHDESQTLIIPPPDDSGELTPADLAQMAVPVAAYITQTQPDIVVGCDRGGRLYSLAVYSFWNERHPKKRFPTFDGKMHFARLSTAVNNDAIDRSVRRIVKQSRKQAKITEKSVNGEQPRILFIDDWINSGATREHIIDSLDRLGLKDRVTVNFAVMCGGNADVSGGKKGNPSWHDDPNVIGIDYEPRSAKPFSVRTKAVRNIREAIHIETKKVAESLRVAHLSSKKLGKLAVRRK